MEERRGIIEKKLKILNLTTVFKNLGDSVGYDNHSY